MKKVLSVFLAVLLICLTFVSCGNEENPVSSSASSSEASSAPVNLVDVEIEFGNKENATISYTNMTEFTTTENADYETMTSDYLYLPAGTVLSSDKEFALYCYNDSFAIDSLTMKGCGQDMNGYNPTPKAATLTLKVSCYARISVKGALTDVKVQVPEGLKDAVLCAPEADMLVHPKVNVVNQFLSNNANSVNYIFITDIHYGSSVDDLDGDGIRTYETVEAVAKQLESLRALVEQTVIITNNSPYIDFLVIGGDIVNGYETEDSYSYIEAKKNNKNLTIGKHVVKQIQQVLAPLKNCKKPVFILSGNHDDNTGHSIYRSNDPSQVQSVTEWHVSDLDWNNGVLKEFLNVDVVRDEDYSYKGSSISKYYYYDLEKNGKTSRLLFLDYNDDRFTFDSKGEVTARPNWGEYHEGQIKWLAETALQGDFDECLVFSHASMTNDAITNILDAYQTKDRMKQGGEYAFNVSFANRTTGDIKTYHHGHEHKQYHSYDYKKRFWRISTAMAVTNIDIVSVGENSTFLRDLNSIMITELSSNGSESSTVQ